MGLILHTPMFSHGQLYVALSRVSRWEDLRIFQRDDLREGVDGRRSYHVVNHVFSEILQ